MANFDPQQLRSRLFDTTFRLWRLCDRFPVDDQALVRRVREKAITIMDDANRYFSVRDKSVGSKYELLHNLVVELETLRALLELGKARNHVQEMNFLFLDWEYEQLLVLLKDDAGALDITDVSSARLPGAAPAGLSAESSLKAEAPTEQEDIESLSSRQKHLYEFLLRNKRATIRELGQAVSGVTDRTLRDDLWRLQELKLIRRVGRHPRFVYILQSMPRPVPAQSEPTGTNWKEPEGIRTNRK